MGSLARTLPLLPLLASACGPHFPRPFLADAMVSVGTGAALADYLTQENASPEVCDRQSRGPHMGLLRKDDLGALTGGLVNGSIPAATWGACAKALLKTPASEESAFFFDSMGKAYEKLLRNTELETKPDLQARVAVLHDLYLLRPPGLEPHALVMTELLAHLEAGKKGGKLGPFALARGDDLLATVELGRDRWKGEPVTVATLDDLAAKGEEALLRRFALRLASHDLQEQARRRVIQIHIAASKWPEVRGHAAEVLAAVLANGRFPMDLTQHHPVRGALDVAALPLHGILIRQSFEDQVVTLLAEEAQHDPGARGKLVPHLPLRGPLQVSLTGVSSAVTLCAPPEELDVTPCVLAHEVHVATPFVDLDDQGNLHFIEHAHTADIMNEVHERPKASWAVELGGTKVLTFEWPMYFEKPADVVLTGAPGGLGPNVLVTAEERALRLFFQIDTGTGPRLVAIEKEDATSFRIVSRGAHGSRGSTGSSGSNGTSGSSGTSGSCPGSSGGNGGNGSAGGNGGPGGPGGPGGNGGDMLVKVHCVANECQTVGRILEPVVKSEGGPGGPGGAGGRGGQGGAGGSGGSRASCTDSGGHSTSVGGGSSGSSGSNGSDGPRGPDGPPGKAGKVTYVIAR